MDIRRRQLIRAGTVVALGATGSGCSQKSKQPEDATEVLPASAAVPELPADTWLEIDLDNIAWNLKQLRSLSNNSPIMAVIKANAYGHGVVETGRFLQKQKVHSLAVAKFHEAWVLRQGGVTLPILYLGYYARPHADAIVAKNISQSVYTDDFRFLAEAARRRNTKAKVHIKIDTGLGRLGVPHRTALPFVKKVASTEGIQIEGIFTPLTEETDFDRVQVRRLLEICDGAKKSGIDVGLRHALSSGGVFNFSEGILDMVRPGIALYGGYPSVREYEARKVELRPAMSLKTRVLYVKTIVPGESISYHRAFVAEKPTRVATISCGYSDGYHYALGGRSEVLIKGQRRPSIALVTANHMTIDITGLDDVKAGDEVVLFGKQGERTIDPQEVAAWADISVYKVLIYMNPGLPREYLSKEV